MCHTMHGQKVAVARQGLRGILRESLECDVMVTALRKSSVPHGDDYLDQPVSSVRS